MISVNLLKELQTIIAENYGVELSIDEVAQLGADLTGFFDVLTKKYYENNN